MIRRLVSSDSISCNKEKLPILCHVCQLGKHVKLPFVSSSSSVTSCFDIVHSDLWTSPIPSLSGFKYYVLFLDHYSQYVWVYPLINKYDVLSKFQFFVVMFVLSLSVKLNRFSVIMVVNLIILPFINYFQPMASSLDSLALAPLNKMENLNA